MLTVAIVIGLSNNSTDSGVAGARTPSADSRAQSLAARVSAPENCPGVRKAVRFYERRMNEWKLKMGLSVTASTSNFGCPRYRLHVLKRKAHAWRVRYGRWHAYHYNWADWLPDKWQRIGACETGYGQRPGNWRHQNSSYGGAFGFALGSWTAFIGSADSKAGPYPARPWEGTPRQQYEVALAIWRRYGFSGWGCRGA